ncbi:MAG: hypothetical protein NTW01_00035 [Gammaproteobacteria bacterium]|nr:hypothetical protein [Gammaproteobacteria bacterium]
MSFHLLFGDDRTIFQGALTKKALLSLPDERFMMSGVCNSVGDPLLYGAIPNQERRQAFWLELKALGVAGRNCHVFATSKNVDRFWNSLRSATHRGRSA